MKKFNFWLEENLIKGMKKAAKEQGLTVSAWLRQLIINTLKINKES